MKSVPSKASAYPSAEAQRRLAYFNERRDEMVSTIRELVEIESPSDSKAAVDRVSEAVAQKFSRLGGEVRIHPARDFGNHLQVDFAGKSAKPLLLLGHYDTVYPLGTLANMPCRVVDNKLTGPGVLDMKSGIALMLHALAALQAWNGTLPRPVTVFLVSDEEVGSDSSRAITESLAKKTAAVLVLEPSYGSQGAVKTARKGVGRPQDIGHVLAAGEGAEPQFHAGSIQQRGRRPHEQASQEMGEAVSGTACQACGRWTV